MFYSGITDEAGKDIDLQIKASKELGWKFIESRSINSSSLAFMDDENFEIVCGKLKDADIKINCFASGIANWQKPINQPPDSSYDEMKKAIPRMQKLGIKNIRIMSFAVPVELREQDLYAEVIKRVKVIVKMAEDAGILCLHENCMNWGGLSYEHTLRLLEGVNSKAMKLVFDTGNPAFNDDVRGKAPYKKQDSWEFYTNVKEFIEHVHIKDGYQDSAQNKFIFTFPGEGKGYVKEIVSDLLKSGYKGGFSIEPHIATVFHDKDSAQNNYAEVYCKYVEYGKRFIKLVEDCKKSI